jgi:hypothetical protein
MTPTILYPEGIANLRFEEWSQVEDSPKVEFTVFPGISAGGTLQYDKVLLGVHPQGQVWAIPYHIAITILPSLERR